MCSKSTQQKYRKLLKCREQGLDEGTKIKSVDNVTLKKHTPSSIRNIICDSVPGRREDGTGTVSSGVGETKTFMYVGRRESTLGETLDRLRLLSMNQLLVPCVTWVPDQSHLHMSGSRGTGLTTVNTF